MSQSWIPVGISDIVPSCTNGIKALSLSHEFKEKLCKPWSHSVVVRLLGKTIGYTYLCHRLHSMWKPAGSMHIVDLDRSCFLVKFTCEQDYFKALTGGPWQIEYENLPNLCFECGRVGHERSECPSRLAMIALEQQPKAPPGTGEAAGSHEPPAADSFGPWMMASRRSRRPAKESGEKRKGALAGRERSKLRKVSRASQARRSRRISEPL
ncbi:hypothetical protein LINPERHAP2_LOCUS12708 [Linum perenne]